MAGYIAFSEDERRRARETDLVLMLQAEGAKVKKVGSEFVYGESAEEIHLRGNLWYRFYDQEGGDAVDFVRKFYGKTYPEAVEFLLGNCAGLLRIPQGISTRKKELIMPERNDNLRRVFAYLTVQRGLDREVVRDFVRCGLIYEDAVYHNCVFVGTDENGTAKHCHKRSTGSRSTFKANAPGSDPAYSFHWLGGSENLFLFEAPIDLLSYISLHKTNWQRHNYAACCGVSDRVLFHILDTHPEIQNVFLCLDNDDAGQTASRRITEKLKQKQVHSEVLVPIRKDWNEDLLAGEEATECQDLPGLSLQGL